jgi:hypothetical protein
MTEEAKGGNVEMVMPFDSVGVILVQVLVLTVGPALLVLGLGLTMIMLVIDPLVVVVVAALDRGLVVEKPMIEEYGKEVVENVEGVSYVVLDGAIAIAEVAVVMVATRNVSDFITVC